MLEEIKERIMLKYLKRIDDPSGIVSKLIFEDDKAIAEAVVYYYQDRGVICFSVQSGCPVGCTFCGTGKKFIRNLTKEEIELQIETCLPIIKDRDKIQLMAMSMGEPLYNFGNIPIIKYLDHGFYVFISSVGLARFNYEKILALAENYDRFGFQISLHDWKEARRKILLGDHENLKDLYSIKLLADEYKYRSGSPMYFNYIAKGDETEGDVLKILDIVSHGHITISVLCLNEFAQGDPKPAKRLASMILDKSPEQSIKLFDPAGQDTIGGGCGQLLYVQKKFKIADFCEQQGKEEINEYAENY